ncbi:hypothetical protein CFP56_001548, partial [Quercus suber]
KRSWSLVLLQSLTFNHFRNTCIAKHILYCWRNEEGDYGCANFGFRIIYIIAYSFMWSAGFNLPACLPRSLPQERQWQLAHLLTSIFVNYVCSIGLCNSPVLTIKFFLVPCKTSSNA